MSSNYLHNTLSDNDYTSIAAALPAMRERKRALDSLNQYNDLANWVYGYLANPDLGHLEGQRKCTKCPGTGRVEQAQAKPIFWRLYEGDRSR